MVMVQIEKNCAGREVPINPVTTLCAPGTGPPLLLQVLSVWLNGDCILLAT